MLTTSQHGFRPNHSTVSAMLEIANKWFQNIDIGQLNGVVFLDLKKAFDTVDHGILLHKLYLYGIKGVAFNWFRSYSSNRKQYCQVNDHLSNPLEIPCILRYTAEILRYTPRVDTWTTIVPNIR